MQSVRQWIADWSGTFLFFALILAARSSFADHYFVPTGSMEHTLVPGDHVVVNKMAYGLRLPFTRLEVIDQGTPARGEVVVFDSPEDGTRLIKRVVAVSGDLIEVNQGRLSINGRALAQGPHTEVEVFGERIARLNLADGGGPNVRPQRVPEGYVVVIGDHRGDSMDSRHFGLVEADAAYGKALGVVYRRQQGFLWQRL